MASTLTTVHTRKVPNKEAISFPVLTYTDAMPRNDLRPINDSRHEHGKIGSWSFPRPGTTDGHTNRNRPPGGNATFDFRLTVPPDEVLPSSARSDRSPVGPHIIGVALGSPSMLNSQESLPPPRFNTSIFSQSRKQLTPPSRKASKWKKIGALFKAKNALAPESDNALPEQKHSTAREKPPASDRKPTQRNEPTEEWPRVEIGPKTTSNKTSSPQRSRKFSMSGRKPSKDTNYKENLHLDINIPDVQMDRYSVMFSNVMDRNQRPSLLARRAKTLDSLRVPNAEPFLAAKGLPIPRRRATSPAHSNFTLFPTSQPPKAAKVLGTQNFSRGPTPLVRANTLPAESPSKASLEPPRLLYNNNSTTSFESGVLPNLFSERSHTPRSSKGSIQNQDKPLPAIKPESQAQPKPQKLSPQAIRAVQSSNQGQRIVEKLNAVKSEKPVKARRNRPNLTIKTGASEPPRPSVKDENARLSESVPATQPAQGLSEAQRESTESPIKAASPASDPNPQPVPPEQIRIPLVAEPEEITAEEPSEPLPTIEVSTARSVSVKRSKRQVLVPIGARMDHLSSNERFVDRKALTPRIMDVRPGHKHAVSQELQIESL